MSDRICKACGSRLEGNATREHILPQWVHPYVEITGAQLEHRTTTLETTTLFRKHGLNNYAHKAICETCNNTWMSRLEDQAKPLLVPLIEETRSVQSLTEEELFVVARWAFKTAFMVLSGQTRYAVHWEYLQRWVHGGALKPDPAIIFALSDLHIPQGFSYITQADEIPSNPGRALNLRVSIAIRSLLLIVILPNDDRRRVARRGHSSYRLLWPTDMPVVAKAIQSDVNRPMPYADFIKCLSDLVDAGLLHTPEAPEANHPLQ